MYYRATTSDRDDVIEYTQGEYYEKLIDGQPALLHAGNHAGFQKSNTPELCASHSVAASLFAAAHNGSSGEYHIYAIDAEPDVDISDVAFDFGVIEEVRYRDLQNSPVTATHTSTVTVPDRAITDIDLAYLPPGPSIITNWAVAVKEVLSDTVLNDDPYPDTAATVTDIDRPDPETYKTPRPA